MPCSSRPRASPRPPRPTIATGEADGGGAVGPSKSISISVRVGFVVPEPGEGRPPRRVDLGVTPAAAGLAFVCALRITTRTSPPTRRSTDSSVVSQSCSACHQRRIQSSLVYASKDLVRGRDEAALHAQRRALGGHVCGLRRRRTPHHSPRPRAHEPGASAGDRREHLLQAHTGDVSDHAPGRTAVIVQPLAGQADLRGRRALGAGRAARCFGGSPLVRGRPGRPRRDLHRWSQPAERRQRATTSGTDRLDSVRRPRTDRALLRQPQPRTSTACRARTPAA